MLNEKFSTNVIYCHFYLQHCKAKASTTCILLFTETARLLDQQFLLVGGGGEGDFDD